MKKKLLAMLCMLATMFSSLPTAFADNIVFVQRPFPTGGMHKLIGADIVLEDDGGIYRTNASASAATLYDVLEDGMRQHKDTINISAFGYTNTDANKNKILDVLSQVVYENYDIMSFTGFYSVVDGIYITGVKPMYLFSDLAEDVSARQAMDAKINEYIALAEGVPDDAGKVLIIHDAFCKNNEYATEELAVANGKIESKQTLAFDDEIIFTPYGALMNNRAVCQGISITLAAIYNKMGIETGFCESDEINHIWNVVKIGGIWYQLDATWDDQDVIAGTDSEGKNILLDKCFHDYFLCSDAAFSDHGSMSGWEYYTNDGNVSCADASFETGHIYSGQYIYNNANYGGWYGTVGYENGKYIIDVWAVKRYIKEEAEVLLLITGFTPFSSKKIRAEILTSDIIESVNQADNGDGTTTNTVTRNIIVFATSDLTTNVKCRYSAYENGKISKAATRANISGMGQMSFGSVSLPTDAKELKVFFWKADTQEPVCEARSIN